MMAYYDGLRISRYLSNESIDFWIRFLRSLTLRPSLFGMFDEPENGRKIIRKMKKRDENS